MSDLSARVAFLARRGLLAAQDATLAIAVHGAPGQALFTGLPLAWGAIRAVLS